MATKTIIKEELDFNNTMKQLVEALKGIAASQFQSLKKNKTEKFEKFDTYFTSFFQMVDLVGSDHFVLKPKSDVQGIIVPPLPRQKGDGISASLQQAPSTHSMFAAFSIRTSISTNIQKKGVDVLGLIFISLSE